MTSTIKLEAVKEYEVNFMIKPTGYATCQMIAASIFEKNVSNARGGVTAHGLAKHIYAQHNGEQIDLTTERPLAETLLLYNKFIKAETKCRIEEMNVVIL